MAQHRVRVVTSAEELTGLNDQELWLILPGQGESWIVGGVERTQLVTRDRGYEVVQLAWSEPTM